MKAVKMMQNLKLMKLKMRILKTTKRMIPRILNPNLKSVLHRIQNHLILNNQKTEKNQSTNNTQNTKINLRKITKNMTMRTIMKHRNLPKTSMNNSHAFFLLMVAKISHHRPITVAKTINQRRMVETMIITLKAIMTIRK